MSFQPFHHTIVATDVVGSSARHDQLQLKMRDDLRGVLERTLRRQDLDLAELAPTDLGDGFRLHAPAAVSPLAMVSPFVDNLVTELRVHRQSANERSRLRLRVAIHMGLLNREPHGGWAGIVLSECARLLDAPAARDLIADAPDADLVLVVSDAVFDAVVRQGYGPAPEQFRRIPVTVKESNFSAWAYLPAPWVAAAADSSAVRRTVAANGPTAPADTAGMPSAGSGVVLGSAHAVIGPTGGTWFTAGRRAAGDGV
ncbi:hypothetical protein E0H26_03525 [Micromonospora zingiberis]|uniref:Guanylate cyclase domain-containing protein n=1 Tax=Micromonospora zingiberis TaxID=2053011 RepID=A0A4R0GV54_9ACTN|nr:hypothetical protein [Micromonospora zingiberis]TCB99641.1 hypothetical protein E0H26_03525 [Micromonospora zingiberis]